ncbi:hypothetical protein PISMIDRAFT_306195 [Pisolithus microcarpus 441]|uniref:Uncharacterized protein n=1 Tax=Pisolithus microcarpus 441 TaxID=765257 RepID=A0A0D0AEZ7_9AGAM|nr:hypothetical protein PISMIDRAFT_306195 [Pisolithus microcarpus 441]
MKYRHSFLISHSQRPSRGQIFGRCLLRRIPGKEKHRPIKIYIIQKNIYITYTSDLSE